jgi:hypothetical protein
MDHLASILGHARARRVENCLLAGDSNNGKSTILGTFMAHHGTPPGLRDDEGRPGDRPMSVVLIEMPRDNNEAAFWEAILESMRCAPPRRSENLMRYTCAIMDQLQVRMLMIDEVHNITRLAQRDRLLLVKSLSAHASRALRISAPPSRGIEQSGGRPAPQATLSPARPRVAGVQGACGAGTWRCPSRA